MFDAVDFRVIWSKKAPQHLLESKNSRNITSCLISRDFGHSGKNSLAPCNLGKLQKYPTTTKKVPWLSQFTGETSTSLYHLAACHRATPCCPPTETLPPETRGARPHPETPPRSWTFSPLKNGGTGRRSPFLLGFGNRGELLNFGRVSVHQIHGFIQQFCTNSISHSVILTWSFEKKYQYQRALSVIFKSLKSKAMQPSFDLSWYSKQPECNDPQTSPSCKLKDSNPESLT